MRRNIQRSMLIVPANVPRFVDKAHQRNADAVVLDLEDSVPTGEKAEARKLVRSLVGQVGRGGADVLVRVNNEPELLWPDMEASVHPGVHAIFVPKVESALQVTALEERVADLEKARGMVPGSVKLSLHIESPKALLRVEEIAGASSRTESMSLGTDDYCLSLGIQPTEEGVELLFTFSMLVIASKAAGINPIGIAGRVADFSNLESFRAAAERGRQLGFTGAYCIHPGQVKILNEVFSPLPERVEHARRAVEAFEEGVKKGRASVSLDGQMVDTPIYKQAKQILELAEAVAEKEKRKAEALAHLHAIVTG